MNDADLQLLSNLQGAEHGYAAAFADYLACGDPRPDPEVWRVDPLRAETIRAVLLREWDGRIHRNPVLSGRARVKRVERGAGGS